MFLNTQLMTSSFFLLLSFFYGAWSPTRVTGSNRPRNRMQVVQCL